MKGGIRYSDLACDSIMNRSIHAAPQMMHKRKTGKRLIAQAGLISDA